MRTVQPFNVRTTHGSLIKKMGSSATMRIEWMWLYQKRKNGIEKHEMCAPIEVIENNRIQVNAGVQKMEKSYVKRSHTIHIKSISNLMQMDLNEFEK